MPRYGHADALDRAIKFRLFGGVRYANDGFQRRQASDDLFGFVEFLARDAVYMGNTEIAQQRSILSAKFNSASGKKQVSAMWAPACKTVLPFDFVRTPAKS